MDRRIQRIQPDLVDRLWLRSVLRALPLEVIIIIISEFIIVKLRVETNQTLVFIR